MSQDGFVTALKVELRRRGIRCRRSDLLDFIKESERQIAEDPNVCRWADRFAEVQEEQAVREMTAKLEVRIDHNAPPGNVVPLVRLLLKLAKRELEQGNG